MKKLLMMIGAAASCVALSMSALADLPSGYRQLDYVETDGNQWVNTLFEPTCTNAVEIKASVANPNREQFLYCSRRATGSNSEQYRRWHSLCITGGKARFDYAYWYNETSTLTGGQAYVFAAMPEEKSGQEEIAESSKQWHLNMYIDDALVSTSGDRNFWVPVYDSSHQYFCLFGSYAGNLADDTTVASKAICRFYYFKVWDTKDKGNLLCHIVPVYGEVEQAIGLYDLVAGRFLPVHGNPFSGSYSLTADEEWATVDTMSGTVDLNGHDLTAATVAQNMSSSVAGAGYQDLAFITATCNAIQVTGFQLPGTAVVKMKFRPAKLSATQWLFSSRTAVKNNAYGAVLVPDKIRFDFYKQQTTGNTTLQAGCDCEAVFDGTTATPTWLVNGKTEKAHAATSNEFTAGGDLFVCGSSLSGTLFSGRVYYFTVTTNDMVALDLRPIRRLSDGVVGLYDTVGGTFYPSGTSTAFPSLATPAFANTSATASELRVGQELIPGYTVVECITGTGSQWIDTRLVPASTDKIEMKASLADTPSNASYGLFCSRKTSSSEQLVALYFGGNGAGIRFDFSNSSGHFKTQWKPTPNEPFTVALDGQTKICYTNNAACTTLTEPNDFTPTANMRLFCLHTNNGSSSSCAKGAIYWFKVTGKNGEKRLDMVPVVRDVDSIAGLYDLVNGVFYPSSSDTAFTAGGATLGGLNADCAFDATEIAGNITLVKNGEGAFDGGGTTLAGTLKPVAGTVGGVTLQNGATLDLSALSEAFSLDDNAVSFANGASITIALGSRTASSKTPLVSWTTPPANLGTLKFVRAAGASRGFVVKSDGIYLAPKGLIISFF